MPVVLARPDQHATGYIGRIPVRNLWLLMLYASELRHLQRFSRTAAEDNPDEIPDLVAEYLARIVEKRMRRNLSYSFSERTADLNRVRGRIQLLHTERHQLLRRGQVCCTFTELTVDSARNRYVRGALELGARIAQDPPVRRDCRRLCESLSRQGVSSRIPSPAELLAEGNGSRDREDQRMLDAARLVYEFNVPLESGGGYRTAQPDREAHWLRRLYEKAIGGFYEVMLGAVGWQVFTGQRQAWQITEQTSRIGELLPAMQTDIVLETPEHDRRIVIDTKFNEIATRDRFDHLKFRSGYVYQVYAYLLSQVRAGDPLSDTASGMLLHPSVDADYYETVTIQGHKLRFATVDLAAPLLELKQRLLDVIEGL